MKGGSIVDVERVKERNKRVAKANAELKKIISYNVRYYRTIRGMNEDELASYLGKKGQYIKKLENGELKANPPIDTIDKIAWALGVPFVAIFRIWITKMKKINRFLLESTNPNNLNSKECLALIEILKNLLNQKYIELEEMFFKGQYEMLYTLNRMDYFDKDIDNKS